MTISRPLTVGGGKIISGFPRGPNGLVSPMQQEPTPAYSVRTEIAAASTSNLGAAEASTSKVPFVASLELAKAIDECRHQRDEQQLLPSWKSRLAFFAAPFRLFLAMEAGGREAVEHVLKFPPFTSRKRKPSLEKTALIAITFFALPEAPGENSLCSDYACVIEAAHDKGVTPEQIETWLASTTLADCKKMVRAKRAAKSAKPSTAADADNASARTSLAAERGATAWISPERYGYRLRTVITATGKGTELALDLEGPESRLRLTVLDFGGEPLPALLHRLADEYQASSGDSGEGNDA
ncbi:hypothetical protein RFM41_13115 [Mesorhizobium sp. VK25A]|uniref:Uncharacterized protein n=1 Tax=Mesorhizobium vachelliae TaxID=3072309 RepID=A0ABU5A6K7_9HYPH|nr:MULTISPECIES: hypothetical protein [unclassified Mesorhizobium]MDX8532810.1 hypothetical protein [Mesorhizobium sp. VK25D]MDX8544684.1 hypothetical protein [Mesorhizobium sp. VK25A]